MASSKTLFFACLLVAAVAVPMAQATIPIILPPIVLPPIVLPPVIPPIVLPPVTLPPIVLPPVTLPPLLPTLAGVIRIQGIVFCTVNGTINPGSGLLTPRFPNATVLLLCGPANTTVASVTTNSVGAFSILLDPLSSSVPQILAGCRLVVTTPLASCNATLSPTGTLTSALTFVNTTLAGLLPIINIGALGFTANVSLSV